MGDQTSFADVLQEVSTYINIPESELSSCHFEDSSNNRVICYHCYVRDVFNFQKLTVGPAVNHGLYTFSSYFQKNRTIELSVRVTTSLWKAFRQLSVSALVICCVTKLSMMLAT